LCQESAGYTLGKFKKKNTRRARPYSPQDKALVEGAVKLVYQRVFYPLSKHTFFSLAALNNEIALLLETYNNYQFSQSSTTRREEFSALEKQYLQKLPADRYEIKEYKTAKFTKLAMST